MDHSPAEKDGSRLLGKFRSQKDKSQLSAIKINSSNMNSPNVGSPDSTSTITPARKIFFSSKYNGDIPSFFDAVADGSDLVILIYYYYYYDLLLILIYSNNIGLKIQCN